MTSLEDATLLPPFQPFTVGPAADQLARDAALIEDVQASSTPAGRWYQVDAPALVAGFAQRSRLANMLDLDRSRAAGLPVLERQAGGGLVWLDPGLLCLAIAVPVPHPLTPPDVTLSYRWLGERLAAGLRAIGVAEARRAEVEEARSATRHWLFRHGMGLDPQVVTAACYGGLSPHEVVVGNAKLVGLAQVRRRDAALFQAGIVLGPQAPLVDWLRLPGADEREEFRKALRSHVVGLDVLLSPSPAPELLAAALEPHLRGLVSVQP